jgi:hypothetical protein
MQPHEKLNSKASWDTVVQNFPFCTYVTIRSYCFWVLFNSTLAYGANHLEPATFVQKICTTRKNPKSLFPLVEMHLFILIPKRDFLK